MNTLDSIFAIAPYVVEGLIKKLHCEEHENGHREKKFNCRKCDHSFYHEYMLNRHEESCTTDLQVLGLV